MSINATTRSNKSTVNVRYSGFLGCLYVANASAEAAIATVKARIGDDNWKKGFTGYADDSLSRQARNELDQAGVILASTGITGTLISASVVMHDIQGVQTPYLNVGLTDDTSTEFISIDLSSKAAQMLVRKLANCQLRDVISVNLFGTFDKKPGKDRAYADHCASVKFEGNEVRGIDPQLELVPLKNDTKAQFAKIPGIKPEVVRAQLDAVEVDFHQRLLTEISERFNAAREAAKASSKQASAEAQADASIPM